MFLVLTYNEFELSLWWKSLNGKTGCGGELIIQIDTDYRIENKSRRVAHSKFSFIHRFHGILNLFCWTAASSAEIGLYAVKAVPKMIHI